MPKPAAWFPCTFDFCSHTSQIMKFVSRSTARRSIVGHTLHEDYRSDGTHHTVHANSLIFEFIDTFVVNYALLSQRFIRGVPSVTRRKWVWDTIYPLFLHIRKSVPMQLSTFSDLITIVKMIITSITGDDRSAQNLLFDWLALLLFLCRDLVKTSYHCSILENSGELRNFTY